MPLPLQTETRDALQLLPWGEKAGSRLLLNTNIQNRLQNTFFNGAQREVLMESSVFSPKSQIGKNTGRSFKQAKRGEEQENFIGGWNEGRTSERRKGNRSREAGYKEEEQETKIWSKSREEEVEMKAGVSILRYISISILIKYSNLSRFCKKKTGSIL